MNARLLFLAFVALAFVSCARPPAATVSVAPSAPAPLVIESPQPAFGRFQIVTMHTKDGDDMLARIDSQTGKVDLLKSMSLAAYDDAGNRVTLLLTGWETPGQLADEYERHKSATKPPQARVR